MAFNQNSLRYQMQMHHHHHQHPPMPGPYMFHVPCPSNHVGYIVGKGGRGIRNLVEKWNGRIIEAKVCQPAPEYNRPETHVTIIGEERAVHLLANEINDMIKVSMSRQEKRLVAQIKTEDSNLQTIQALKLRIALLEQQQEDEEDEDDHEEDDHEEDEEDEDDEDDEDDHDEDDVNKGWGVGKQFIV